MTDETVKPMTPEELKEIEERRESEYSKPTPHCDECLDLAMLNDIAALIAEVKRLKDENEREGVTTEPPPA